MAISFASPSCLFVYVPRTEQRKGVLSAARPSIVFSMASASLERRERVFKLRQSTVRQVRNPGLKVVAEVNRTFRAGSKEVIMVDPIEAKRLAAEQMQKLQASAKFKRQCRVEAINGGWAMLGLTTGIVIEGYTGKCILSQVAGYLDLLADVLDNYFPS